MTSFKKWKPVLALFALTWLAYYPALRNGYVWDDNKYVTENTTLHSVDGLRKIWMEPGSTPQYYPLVFSTFWIEHRLWELNPTGYHAVNILLHAANAILLWTLLGALAVPGAWVAAAIFAVHPVHVESVAWISERKNLLSGFFYFLSFLGYLKFLKASAGTAGRQRWWWLSFSAFIFALLSKTVTCSLPAVFLLIHYWKEGKINRRQLTSTAPFFVAGAGMALVTVLMEIHHVGARGSEWNLTFLDRLIIAGRALWFYAEKIILPINLSFNYARWNIDSSQWGWYLFPAGFLVVAGLLWFFRNKISKGPFVALGFFFVTLFPALGFFDIYPMRYSFVADHFQYLGSIGILVFIGFFLKKTPAVFVVLVLSALVFSTQRQAAIYKNQESLWRDTIAKNPGSWIGHYNLGVWLAGGERFEEAVPHFRKAVEIDPTSARAHAYLGESLMRTGNHEEGMGFLTEALRLNPNSMESQALTGFGFIQIGDYKKAEIFLKKVLAQKPNFPRGHTGLGIVCFELGRWDEAELHFREAIRIAPRSAPAHADYGIALLKKGRRKEARAHLEKAVALRPKSPAYREYLLRAENEGR